MKHLHFAQALRTSLLDAGNDSPKSLADQLLSADIHKAAEPLAVFDQAVELLQGR